MPVRLIQPYMGQVANTLWWGAGQADLKANGVADDYLDLASDYAPQTRIVTTTTATASVNAVNYLMNSPSAQTLTIPLSGFWPVNTTLIIEQIGAGSTTLIPATGVTLSQLGIATSSSTRVIRLLKTGANTWLASAISSLDGEYNFSAPQFTKWKAAVARVKAGTGRAKVVHIGDSTTWGEGGGDVGTQNRLNAKLYCAPTVAANRINALGIPTLSENVFASGANTGITTITDWRNYYKPYFNAAASWILDGSSTAGGCYFSNTADAANLTVMDSANPANPITDTFVFYNLRASGAGVIKPVIDGVAGSNITQTNASASFATDTISLGAPASHTVAFQRVSGKAFFGGYYAYDSTVPAVDYLNLGRGSSTTADWLVATAPYNSFPAFQAIAADADLIIIDLTINDGFTGVADATYKTNLQSIITGAVATGASVLLTTGNPSRTDVYPDAKQQSIRQAMRELAISNNLPMLDQYLIYTDWVSMNANGFMFNANHPSKAGYADYGSRLGTILAKWAN